MQPESQDINLPHKKTLKEKLLRAFTMASAGLLGVAGGHYLVAPLVSSALEEPIEELQRDRVREGVSKSIKTTPAVKLRWHKWFSDRPSTQAQSVKAMSHTATPRISAERTTQKAILLKAASLADNRIFL